MWKGRYVLLYVSIYVEVFYRIQIDFVLFFDEVDFVIEYVCVSVRFGCVYRRDLGLFECGEVVVFYRFECVVFIIVIQDVYFVFCNNCIWE